MRKILFLLSVLSIAIFIYAQNSPLGTVEFVIGNANLIKADKSSTKIKKGLLVYGGETIRTAASSQVKVRLKDGSLVEILQNSEIIINKVDEKNNKFAFGVISGGMKSNVNKMGQNDYYKVYTPTSVAGVRGTEFLVSVSENGKANIVVKEGAITLDNEEKKEIIQAGEKAIVNLWSKVLKGKIETKDMEKENENFQKNNTEIEKPEESITQASEKLKQMEERNAKRLEELKNKKKLTEAEQEELETLYQKSVNQGKGWYRLSENIFTKYKNNPLIKRNFYEVQKSLKTIEDQIAEMDAFIDKMSKEIEDFTSDVSQDIEDLSKGNLDPSQSKSKKKKK